MAQFYLNLTNNKIFQKFLTKIADINARQWAMRIYLQKNIKKTFYITISLV